MLTKSNTNLILGLARLQKSAKDPKIKKALNSWTDAVESKLLTEENVCLSLWQENNKFNVKYLGADHAVIDALLDIYFINSNKNALKLAVKITEGWLNYQSKIGLVPETPTKYDTSKLSGLMKNFSMTRTDIARLDSQTDFGVVLLKMYEVTKKQKYYNAAKKIAQGIIRYHKYKKGYAEFVNVETKEKYGKTIETKFLFLLLKFFILLNEVACKRKIYNNALLKDIIRDR